MKKVGPDKPALKLATTNWQTSPVAVWRHLLLYPRYGKTTGFENQYYSAKLKLRRFQ